MTFITDNPKCHGCGKYIESGVIYFYGLPYCPECAAEMLPVRD
jgi:Zn finger protein HypA/HybF involved in hydrogenase expression